MLEFGLYGWALSRYSGAWVGFKAISETVESGSTVDLDALQTQWPAPEGFTPPAGGLHNRWPDLPSLTIEARLAAKLDAVRHFARTNSIDKWIAPSAQANVGIVTCGKAHLDLMEALRRLDLTVADLDAAGVRIYKVGLSYPLEMTRVETFVDGLAEVLVIEEKAPSSSSRSRTTCTTARKVRARAFGSTTPPAPACCPSLANCVRRASCRCSPTGSRATSRRSTVANAWSISSHRRSCRTRRTR